MSLYLYPLGYLWLRDEKDRTLGRRDLPATLFLAALIVAPFFIPGTNFFGAGGFMTNLMNLCAALAGFYVAALVAAATLIAPDIDKQIMVGQVRRFTANGADRLSRREYVCALFGYLAFLAFALAISVNIATAVAGSETVRGLLDFRVSESSSYTYLWIVSAITKVLVALPVAHLCIVTSFGLYYFIKRLHEQTPKLLPKSNRDDKAA